MTKQDRKNKYYFGLGTIGRDMFYAFESNAMLYFLSNVLPLPLAVFATMSVVLSILRIADAFNDPVTGLFIDNMNTKWGRLKPAIMFGAIFSSLFYLVLFANLGTGVLFVVIFSIAYIGWDITYGINDIAYWSVLPAIAETQEKREDLGAFARICASIGIYIVMIGWQPITSAMGNTPKSWLILAACICVFYIGFSTMTVFGVKCDRVDENNKTRTSFKEMIKIISRNDQLVWISISMSLFMVAYCTTTGFAAYYMQYVYGNIDMYPIMAAVCGIAQFGAFLLFPYLTKKWSRKKLFRVAVKTMLAGSLVLSHAEFSLIIVIGSIVMILGGQAIVQVLMLVFLSDTIEYGEWKFGKRNGSTTLSFQPMINKLGGAVSTLVISITLIVSGIKSAGSDLAAESISFEGVLIIKGVMILVPVILLILSYYIYSTKYKIDADMYNMMIEEIKERREIDDYKELIKEKRLERVELIEKIREDIREDIDEKQLEFFELNEEIKAKIMADLEKNK